MGSGEDKETYNDDPPTVSQGTSREGIRCRGFILMSIANSVGIAYQSIQASYPVRCPV